MQEPIWGIDLGGTKIEGVILPSLQDPRPILRTRLDTEAGKGYDHIVRQISRLVREMEKQSGLIPRAIGMGTPGVLDPLLQTMKNCNSTELNKMPLKKDIEALLNIPIQIANDANCFALAETHWGVVKERCPESKMVFGIIMGTGVGGGIVFEGKVWNGKQGIAGEWGHNFLDQSGGPCYCGKSGCVETVISGPALERYYEGMSGKKLKLREIVTRHKEQEDEAASQTMDRLSHFFGKAVSGIINMLDPDCIVVGGGVGNIEVIYTRGLASLEHFIFNNRVDTPILKPTLGDSAGVFGAAALVGS